MPYEKAVSRKLNVLPANLQTKVDTGKKLKGGEGEAVKGFACLEEELKKEPEERVPESFTEDYENILNLDDEISIPPCIGFSADDSSYDESDGFERDNVSLSNLSVPKQIAVSNREEKLVVKIKEEHIPKVESAPIVFPPNLKAEGEFLSSRR